MGSQLSIVERPSNDPRDIKVIDGWFPTKAAFKYAFMMTLVYFVDRRLVPMFSNYVVAAFPEDLHRIWPEMFSQDRATEYDVIAFNEFPANEQRLMYEGFKELLTTMKLGKTPPGPDYHSDEPEFLISQIEDLVAMIERWFARSPKSAMM